MKQRYENREDLRKVNAKTNMKVRVRHDVVKEGSSHWRVEELVASDNEGTLGDTQEFGLRETKCVMCHLLGLEMLEKMGSRICPMTKCCILVEVLFIIFIV